MVQARSGVKGEIAVGISGPGLDVTTQTGDQVASILNGIAAIKVGGGLTDIDIVNDRGRNARLGVGVAAINTVIETAPAGGTVDTGHEGGGRFDVALRRRQRLRPPADLLGHTRRTRIGITVKTGPARRIIF